MTTTILDKKQAGREFWDANPCGGEWASYAEFAAWIARTEPYAFQVLAPHEWAGRRVLEVGCGQGAVLNYLARERADTFGVDMSTASVERSRSGARELGLGGGVHVSIADAEGLPFADQSFDAVVSFGVLHHTPDTARAVREIRRVLRPGGLAIVMLYRKGNPKWWATRAIRAVSAFVDRASGRGARMAGRLRADRAVNDPRGTALLELFGVPTLQAFSNEEARRMFDGVASVDVRNHQPGFRRLGDLSPRLRALGPLLEWVDRRTERVWGFYQVIQARR